MSIWNWLTGYDPANAAAADAANAQLQEINRQTYAGTPSEAAVAADYQAQDASLGVVRSGSLAGYGVPTLWDKLTGVADSSPFSVDSESGQVREAAVEGASGIWKSLGSFGGSFLRALPWWLWVGMGVGAFVWLGGPLWLKKQVAKAS